MKKVSVIEPIDEKCRGDINTIIEYLDTLHPDISKLYNALDIYNLWNDFCDNECCANWLPPLGMYLADFVEWLQA